MKLKRVPSILSLWALSLCYAHAAEQKKQENEPSNVLDEVVVTANRSGQTIYEQIQPAYKLSDERLLLRVEPTLGETLNRLPGVSSTGFSPAASRPILRGLGDDRVRMLQNGTSILDVANLSPDHAVSVDPLSVQSIEVVRGPSTLLYGPNTLGGAVNVLDNRIAEERFTGLYPSGSIGLMAGTPDNSFSQSFDANWGTGPWVFHFDYFHRETENLEIPGFARSAQQRAIDEIEDPDHEQTRGYVPNSASETEGMGFGASHVFENGFLGFSFSGMDSDYGVVAKEDVTIGMEQRRFDVRGAVYEPLSFLREIRFNLGYSDYTHTEFEGEEVGTRFDIEGFNGRLEFMHKEVAGFEGTFGYEIEVSDFAALGEEAFIPAVDTTKHSLFFLEEKEVGKLRYQFGMRLDHHSNERLASDELGPTLNVDNQGFSTSTGLIYNITEEYAASASLAYTQRPPTNMELFADGPHFATGSYEKGDANLDNEEAISIDLSIRKKSGWVTGFANAYYYRFNDFINLRNTGEVYEDDHAADPGHGHDHGELPIFQFEAVNADFCGFELETVFHLHGPITAEQAEGKAPADEHRLDVILRSDFVHAENRDSGEALPRIAPFRAGATVEYGIGPVTTFLEGQYSANQNRVPENELPTDSFFLVNAGISYKTKIGGLDSICFLRGVNLTNEEARLSTSFVRDLAPLAGRGIVAGIRTEF
ncbi:MAG: TonB-dependent receptor [Verrucomicrobia bacterium]|nr:MAG: TonB-dependent receptor [Verrucomicrobiota bacterium]